VAIHQISNPWLRRVLSGFDYFHHLGLEVELALLNASEMAGEAGVVAVQLVYVVELMVDEWYKVQCAC
jgi:hypothetical protein